MSIILILYNIIYIDILKLYKGNLENKNFLYTSKHRQNKKYIFLCRFISFLSLMISPITNDRIYH